LIDIYISTACWGDAVRRSQLATDPHRSTSGACIAVDDLGEADLFPDLPAPQMAQTSTLLTAGLKALIKVARPSRTLRVNFRRRGIATTVADK
jgi:hypothetical protein